MLVANSRFFKELGHILDFQNCICLNNAEKH